jgi:transcriptional regulator of met regulon
MNLNIRKEVNSMCHSGNSQACCDAFSCSCGCCGGRPYPRRFLSAKEKLDRLTEYREQLKMELAGVEERIAELKGK